MKIIVLGAGGIGSLYGAKLAAAGFDVTLVGRKDHVLAINKQGLTIKKKENKNVVIKASTSIDSIGSNTLILLTTKAHDNKKAISKIKNKLRKDTVIVCLQNGLYVEDITKNIVGNGYTVLRALTTFSSTFLEPGVIEYHAAGTTLVENHRVSKRLAALLNRCGMHASVARSIKHDEWKKTILNCMLNPVSALFRVPNKGVITKQLAPLLKQIEMECKQVARAEGYLIQGSIAKYLTKVVRGSNNKSSMYQDILKGRKTEIDHINGAVVRLGKQYGISCPVNEALVRAIKILEKK